MAGLASSTIKSLAKIGGGWIAIASCTEISVPLGFADGSI